MRYKILMVHPQVFIDFCKEGLDKMRIVENAIPRDAKFVRAHLNDFTGWGNIALVIESFLFEDLKEGDEIPVIKHPTFEKIYT